LLLDSRFRGNDNGTVRGERELASSRTMNGVSRHSGLAKRDPESTGTAKWIAMLLDSRFRGNDNGTVRGERELASKVET
jgi:hypothetical protein